MRSSQSFGEIKNCLHIKQKPDIFKQFNILDFQFSHVLIFYCNYNQLKLSEGSV